MGLRDAPPGPEWSTVHCILGAILGTGTALTINDSVASVINNIVLDSAGRTGAIARSQLTCSGVPDSLLGPIAVAVQYLQRNEQLREVWLIDLHASTLRTTSVQESRPAHNSGVEIALGAGSTSWPTLRTLLRGSYTALRGWHGQSSIGTGCDSRRHDRRRLQPECKALCRSCIAPLA